MCLHWLVQQLLNKQWEHILCQRLDNKMCSHWLVQQLLNKSVRTHLVNGLTTSCSRLNNNCSHCLFPVVDKSGTTCYQAVDQDVVRTDLFNSCWTSQCEHILLSSLLTRCVCTDLFNSCWTSQWEHILLSSRWQQDVFALTCSQLLTSLGTTLVIKPLTRCVTHLLVPSCWQVCHQAVTRCVRTACSQLLTSLEQLVATSCWQVVINKLLSTCNKVDERLQTCYKFVPKKVDVVSGRNKLLRACCHQAR